MFNPGCAASRWGRRNRRSCADVSRPVRVHFARAFAASDVSAGAFVSAAATSCGARASAVGCADGRADRGGSGNRNRVALGARRRRPGPGAGCRILREVRVRSALGERGAASGGWNAGRRRDPGRWSASRGPWLSRLWPPGGRRRSGDPVPVGLRRQRHVCARAGRRRARLDGHAERRDRFRRRSAELAGSRGHGDRSGVCGAVPGGQQSRSSCRALRLRCDPGGRDAVACAAPRLAVPRHGGFLADLGDAGGLVQ